MSDEELLEAISQKSRMIQALAKLQGQLMKEAANRGIDNAVIIDARRVIYSKEHQKRLARLQGEK